MTEKEEEVADTHGQDHVSREDGGPMAKKNDGLRFLEPFEKLMALCDDCRHDGMFELASALVEVAKSVHDLPVELKLPGRDGSTATVSITETKARQVHGGVLVERLAQGG